VFRRCLMVVAGIGLVCASSGGAARPLATAVHGPILVVASAAPADASGRSASAPSSGCISEPHADMTNSQKVLLGSEIHCPKAGPGVSWSGTMFATMATTLVPVDEMASDPSVGDAGFYKDFDPCSLPGGSDLPGAKLTWKLKIDTGSRETFTYHYTLPDDKAPPLLRVSSMPRTGTKVHDGQTITVHITASEPTNKGPQEGIRDIQLTGPAGLVDSQDYGTHPVACDKSRLTKTFTTTYTVPKSPPAIITLNAHAADFVNNEAAPKSAEFPTGNVWTGKVHDVTHITYRGPSYECPDTEVDDDTFTVTVGANGTVNGTGMQVVTITSCGPGVHRVYDYRVSGQFTGDQFHFTDLGGIGSSVPTVLVVPLSSSKTTAAAQFHGGPVTQSGGGGFSSTYTFSGTVNLTQTSN